MKFDRFVLGFAALFVSVGLMAGCGGNDENAADGDSADAMESELADFAGDWMTEAYLDDGAEPAAVVLLKASGDEADWSLKFTHIEDAVMANNVFMRGDSVVSTWGPFASGVRDGLTVEDMTTYLAKDGYGMSGRAVATYSDGQVMTYRMTGEKVD